jgi:cell division protein FtsQ
MMPDAEPLAPTTHPAGADEVDAAEPDVIDLTDRGTAEGPPRADDTGVETTPPSRRDRLRKVAAIVFITVVVLGAVAVTLTRSPFFSARTIQVNGASHVARADVMRLAAVTRDTNVFTLDAAAAERRLERDPWIAEATVTKDLPSTLIIDIDERVAVALVEFDGILRLVADDGSFLEVAAPRVAVQMPSIVAADTEGVEPSPEAVGGAARAIAAMAPSLRRRVESVSVLADGQLRVDLTSGATVAFGEAADLQEKAMALRALLDYAAERGATVISVDVRVPSAPSAVLAGGEVVTP